MTSSIAARRFFSGTQLLQTVLMLLFAIVGVGLAGFAANYHSLLGVGLVVLAELAAVGAGMLCYIERTRAGMLLALVPLGCAVITILFASSGIDREAAAFIWQNIALAWQALTNR